MKPTLILLIIILSSACYGQKTKVYRNAETVTIGGDDGVIVTYKDKKGKLKSDTIGKDKVVLYGTAGIQKPKQDSSKIYYKKYLQLKKKGVPDSVNKYKILLDRYK